MSGYRVPGGTHSPKGDLKTEGTTNMSGHVKTHRKLGVEVPNKPADRPLKRG